MIRFPPLKSCFIMNAPCAFCKLLCIRQQQRLQKDFRNVRIPCCTSPGLSLLPARIHTVHAKPSAAGGGCSAAALRCFPYRLRYRPAIDFPCRRLYAPLQSAYVYQKGRYFQFFQPVHRSETEGNGFAFGVAEYGKFKVQRSNIPEQLIFTYITLQQLVVINYFHSIQCRLIIQKISFGCFAYF